MAALAVGTVIATVYVGWSAWSVLDGLGRLTAEMERMAATARIEYCDTIKTTTEVGTSSAGKHPAEQGEVGYPNAFVVCMERPSPGVGQQ